MLALRTPFPVKLGGNPPGDCPRRGRARAAVAIGFVLLIASQLGMSFALETVRPAWRDPEYGERLDRLCELRRKYPDRELIVALGSSRTQMGLRPSAMHLDEPGDPLLFNFGQAGAGPMLQYLTLERILAAGIRPDRVLVEFFPAHMSMDDFAELKVPRWQTRFGARDLATLKPYCRDAAKLHRDWAFNRIAPFHTYRHFLLGYWQPEWQSVLARWNDTWDHVDAFGWEPFPFEAYADYWRERWLAQTRERYGPELRGLCIGGLPDRILRDLVKRCRERGIAAAFFRIPEGPLFQGLYPREVKAAADDYLRSLSRELGVPALDVHEEFAEAEFADSHHLLTPGASRFSRLFADRCLRP